MTLFINFFFLFKACMCTNKKWLKVLPCSVMFVALHKLILNRNAFEDNRCYFQTNVP